MYLLIVWFQTEIDWIIRFCWSLIWKFDWIDLKNYFDYLGYHHNAISGMTKPSALDSHHSHLRNMQGMYVLPNLYLVHLFTLIDNRMSWETVFSFCLSHWHLYSGRELNRVQTNASLSPNYCRVGSVLQFLLSILRTWIELYWKELHWVLVYNIELQRIVHANVTK